MAELSKVDSAKHQNLKVNLKHAWEMAAKQHVMNIRAAEVGKAISSFPIFLSKNQNSGNWALSAITSLEPGHNLFVEGGVWAANYQPTGMQTHPFYLMNDEGSEKGYCVGFDEQSGAFSTEDGEPMFEADGKDSFYLTRVKDQLEADLQNDMQTHLFTQRLAELGLTKAVDIHVQYDGSAQVIKGLQTINEDVLQALEAEALTELNQKGYIVLISAMLVSVYQLNTLVTKNNRIQAFKRIKHVKLEPAKEAATGV